MKRASLAVGVLLAICHLAPAQEAKLDLKHRWVYLPSNLLVDKNVQTVVGLMERAAKAGYTGVLLSDSKFMRWDILPARYVENVKAVREACRRNKLDCIAAVCPIGYSNDLLSRDPNLAEGLPVVDAPFVVRGGKLLPADDSAQIVNGGFEQFKGNMPTGWSFADMPGKITFIDTEVKFAGSASLRIQDIAAQNAQYGNGRINQVVPVKPFRYYHVSVAVKTQDFDGAGNTRIAVLTKGGASLNHCELGLARTADWKRVDITFNSLDNQQVTLYLGTWGGKGGKIWWDDVKIEPGGLVNVVRRDGAPLKVTSDDGKTVYEEGKDFSPIADPKLGNVPWPGGYQVWHDQPVVTIPPASRLKEGQKVLLSYYHMAIIYHDQVMCCMGEPKVYEIIQWQVEQVRKHVQPDGYFMSHDEIRVQGWDESCARRKLTPGQILADNVKRCTEIIRKADAGKPIYVWSDMFDPFHNAPKTGSYYLVKGDGPWYGSWEGLDKDVIICNWNSQKNVRLDSLKWFAGRGHKQMLAGYYDGPPERITDWLTDAAKVPGVVAVMYTTWQQRYDDLEKFAETVGRFPR